MPGAVLLAGGGEFLPAFRTVDRSLVEAMSPPRTVHIVLAAAARQQPQGALATAARHFEALGAHAEAIDALTPAQANRAEVVRMARSARFLYIAGGDPGHLLRTLAASRLWDAMVAAWKSGAVIAGSSAGAMVLGGWCLLRQGISPTGRRFAPALGLVPGLVAIPHLDEGGGRWLPGVLEQAPPRASILGIDTSTAVLWQGRFWRVEGRGTAVRFTPGRPRRATAGERLALPAPRPQPLSPEARAEPAARAAPRVASGGRRRRSASAARRRRPAPKP